MDIGGIIEFALQQLYSNQIQNQIFSEIHRVKENKKHFSMPKIYPVEIAQFNNSPILIEAH